MGLLLHTLSSQTFSLIKTPQGSRRPRRLLLIPSSLGTMILNMLVPALILGVVESQMVNVTDGELSSVEKNRTFITTTVVYSSSKPENLTSNFYKDEHLQELLNNQTSVIIPEDDEDFQDQETKHPGKKCNQDLLVDYSYYCENIFYKEMMSISEENWCVLDNIIRPYNYMTICLEKSSGLVGCYYPNPYIQDFFVEVHSFYFQNCTNEDPLLVDAPQWLVIALTLVPVSLIPILVYLVIWKSKVQE